MAVRAHLLLLLLLVGCTLFASCASSFSHPNRPTFSPLVEQFLANLTVEEKVGQLLQLDIGQFFNPETMELNLTHLTDTITQFNLGSVLNSPCNGGPCAGGKVPTLDVQTWRKLITDIQTAFITTGTKIPMIYGLDTIHGANYVYEATLFPSPIGSAATFNRSVAREMGRIGGKDTRSVGIPWVFSPVLGIAVHQGWPRFYETFGEDPLLASEMGAATTQGYQGNATYADPSPLTKNTSVAACMKHFVGYPQSRNGLDRGPSWIPDRHLNNYFVPSFMANVRQGNVFTAMSSYEDLNGEPTGSSHHYLVELLRNKIQFPGMLVTDWGVINDLVDLHRIAPDYRTATFIAMNRTSIDMSMAATTTNFYTLLLDLINDGSISMDRLDVSVGRVLTLKEQVGLFQDPFNIPSDNTVGSPEDRASALDGARQSIILLENNGSVLPFDVSSGKDDSFTVLLTGQSADSLGNLCGGWTLHWQGVTDDSEFPYGSTILESVQTLVSQSSQFSNVVVEYQQGVTINQPINDTMLQAALKSAQQADVVVAVVGELPYAERYGNTHDYDLPQPQQEFLSELIATGKPVVVVLLEGRPKILGTSIDGAAAVIYAPLPCLAGGQAIAEVLFGLVNPSGKLPFTYPAFATSIPIQYYHVNSQVTNSPDGVTVQWEFGTGLSYTTFEYSSLTLSTNSITECSVDSSDSAITISITVTNTGSVAGSESVLLFIQDEYRIISPEVKLLKGFDKVFLTPSQSRVVTFNLNCEDFAFYGLDEQQLTLESGSYIAMIGDQTAQFTLGVDVDNFEPLYWNRRK